MAKSLGIFQRNGTFYLRYIVPQKHRDAFSGRSRIVRSLHTRRRLEARTKALLLRAELVNAIGQVPLLTRYASPPTAATQPAPMGLRTLFQEWLEVKKPSKDTRRACELAVNAFLGLKGVNDIEISTITRKDGQLFASHLMEQSISNKTAQGIPPNQ